MSLDLSAIPSMEPNLLHMRDGRLQGEEQSALSERAGEDYEKIEGRIAKSIQRERRSYLQQMGHSVSDEEELSSDVSFAPEEPPAFAVPHVPKTKTRFSTFLCKSSIRRSRRQGHRGGKGRD